MSDSIEHPLSTEAIQQALSDPIPVPDECICDWVRVLPYRLEQRVMNPDCEADHTSEAGGELEKERD